MYKYIIDGAQRLRHLNLLPSIPPSTDQYQLTTQIISTRLFIITLILSLTILIIYTSAVTTIKTITINAPTLDQYSNLYINYSQSLACPCTKISITYDQLVHVNYALHQVCSSGFVSDGWLNYIFQSWVTGLILRDFRMIGRLQFQALQSLCRLVNDTISNSLTRFYASQYVSMAVTPQLLLESQVDAAVSQLISTTTKDFLSSFRIVRDTIQANRIFAAAQYNAYLQLIPDSQFLRTMWSTYDNLSCISTSTRVSQSKFYNDLTREVVYTVPGMFVGCYLIEALLQSNLECFYNQTCFDEVKFYMKSNAPLSASIMDSSALIQFSSKSSINDILDELMVEEWSWLLTYEDYFAECQPRECSYTVLTRNNALYIVTTMIGVIGGLVTALKLVVPWLVQLVRRQSTETTIERGEKAFHSGFKSHSTRICRSAYVFESTDTFDLL